MAHFLFVQSFFTKEETGTLIRESGTGFDWQPEVHS